MNHSGVIYITLGGVKQRLWFNNFANDELRRYFAKSGEVLSDTDLIKRIAQKWEENYLLFMKNMVYAGILGDSYVKGDVVRISKEEIGEMIATANPEELYGVWKVFLDAQGAGLTPEEGDGEDGEKEPEQEPTDAEKKSQ